MNEKTFIMCFYITCTKIQILEQIKKKHWKMNLAQENILQALRIQLYAWSITRMLASR